MQIKAFVINWECVSWLQLQDAPFPWGESWASSSRLRGLTLSATPTGSRTFRCNQLLS